MGAFVFPKRASGQLDDYYQLQLFDNSFGIRAGNIQGVVKDKDGFIWVLYPKTVQRFDGSESISFKPGPNLESIYVDDNGIIWIVAGKSVLMYDKAKRNFTEIEIKTGDEHTRFSSIVKLPGYKTLLHSNSGFFEWDQNAITFNPVLRETIPQTPYTGRNISTFGNSFYVYDEGNFYRNNIKSQQVDSLPVNGGLFRYFAITEDRLLVTTWEMESYWYDFKDGIIKEAHLPLHLQDKFSPYINARSVKSISPTRFIIAAREGLFFYDSVTEQFDLINIYKNGALISTKDYSNSIFVDDEKNVWLAAVDGVGKFSLTGKNFGLIRMADAINGAPFGIDNIRGISTDEQGNFWLATANGIVKLREDLTNPELFAPVKESTSSLAHPSIRGIYWDGKYVVIAPTDKGIWLYDPLQKKYRRPVYPDENTRISDQNDFYDAVCRMRNGNILFLGRDALYVLNGKTYELSLVETPASKENCNYAWQGPQGEIWLATQMGLHLLDEKLRYIQMVDLQTTSKSIPCGTMLQDGRLLFSVEDGVYAARYYGGNVTFEKFSSAFDGISIRTLLQDRDKMIWATSENGIYRYNPSENSIRLFDVSDNVQGFGFNANSWTITNDGYLLLGGMNGLNFIDPGSIMDHDIDLKIYIDKISAGKEDSVELSPNESPVLSWANRSISFYIVCPYFNDPDKVVYRYKLTGLEEDWKYFGNNRLLRFSSLSPGTYNLQIEGSINQKDWIPALNTYTFKISRPFWKSFWFFSGIAFLIGVLIYFYLRKRSREFDIQKEELEAEQAIHYFSQQMSEKETIEDLMWDVAKNCISRLKFEDCVIYLVDKHSQTIRQVAAYGPKNSGDDRIENPMDLKLGEGISGTVALTGIAEIVADTSNDPRYIHDDQRRFSEICVPVFVDGEVVAVIDSEHSKRDFFTSRHLSTLNTIASLCSSRMIKIEANLDKQNAERKLLVTQKQMAEVEMQALRAQMNPHFIFNCLNSINRYIVKSDQVTASLYLTRFAKLIRLILDHSNSKSISLSNELDALKLYIEMESIRFEKKFEYSIEVEPNVQPDHVQVPPLIIQPYVENAIWHGLLHKETEGKLMIHISRTMSDQLLCLIEDDGIGRKAAQELKSKSLGGRSLGMKLTQSRLEILNLQTGGNAKVEIVDLVSNQGQPSGTRIILHIPIDTLN